jgi:hypothetical protein
VRGKGPAPFHDAPSPHAWKGVGPFLPTRVAAIFGPRGVAKLARSTAALWGDGDPTPHQVCAWLLAIFRKLTGNVAYAVTLTVS